MNIHVAVLHYCWSEIKLLNASSLMSLKFPDHNKNHKTIYPMIIVEIITVLLNYVQDYKNIYNPYWKEAVHV